MKKLVLAVVTSLACIAAFAQGKVGFVNDSLHLVYWGAGSGSYFGLAVNSDNQPNGLSGIGVNLYMGTSSSQLFLYSSTSFGPLASGPGKWSPLNVQANANPGAPAISSGPVFVDIAVLSTEKPAPNVFDPTVLQTFAANGVSTEFTFTLGTSITYPVLYGPNNLGTWPPGTFNMDQYGVGSRGAIEVRLVPEPSSFAFVVLWGVTMLIFRLCK